MTKERLLDIINEEVDNVKFGINHFLIKEEITNEDEKQIRELIRQEVSAIFFDLFKKRKTWCHWEVKTNRIINWGTYTDEQMKEKEVFKPEHPLFDDFLKELDRVKDFPHLIHNFHELYESESTLI